MKYTGALRDNRPKKEKKKDWMSRELLAGAPVVEWEEKKDWKSFTERNQYKTGSCVPQAISKALEINEKNETGKKVVLSATKSYADRSNQGTGSYVHEMLANVLKNKYTTEERLQSQMLGSDAEMEQLAKNWTPQDEKVAKKYAGKSYIYIERDMDTIAYWLEQGFGVVGLMYFTSKEWSKKYPKISGYLQESERLYHEICFVDYGLIKGEKKLKLEDSAHFGNRSERWIGEDWIKDRCLLLAMIYDKPNEEPVIENHKFNTNLYYGQRNDEIVKLQDRLKKEGFFPANIPSTGYYGEITRQSVEKYQRHYKVASEWELNWVAGKIVGAKTRRQLNSKL